jgi:hypothetical protein
VEEFQDNLAGVVYSGVLGGKHLEFPGMMWGGRDKAESMNEARMPLSSYRVPAHEVHNRQTVIYIVFIYYICKVSL